MKGQFRKRVEAAEQRATTHAEASAATRYAAMTLDEMQAELDAARDGEDDGDPWEVGPDYSAMSIAEIAAELEAEMADAP